LDDFGLEYNNPDFVKYADSYGAKGHKVEDANQFLPLIRSFVGPFNTKQSSVKPLFCCLDSVFIILS
jgi:hypothetical protein